MSITARTTTLDLIWLFAVITGLNTVWYVVLGLAIKVCWYVLTRGLAAGVGGGGGQVGGWTGARANFAAEVLQIGVGRVNRP